MIICKTIKALNEHLNVARTKNQTIGFVPTMGALHQGHISLIELSKQQSNLTVCSIFVNPTQFNDKKDFEKYPITIEKDILLLEKANCDFLFLPYAKEIYPNDNQLNKAYELGFIERILEGKSRPGHFQGVCQVVERLLTIVQPNFLFLGQKDYQQCMVINKLIELMGWQNKLQLIIGSTLREASGLAMSSRNMRLSNTELVQAATIYQSLNIIKKGINQLPIPLLIENAKKQLLEAGFEKIDYVAICDAVNLSEVSENDSKTKLVVLAAAFLNGVRLIDNLLLES